MRPRDAAWLMLLAGAGCRGDGRGQAPPPGDPTGDAPPADSLALRTGTGAEVWFTGSRPAHDSTGVPCTERVMEIRAGDRRTRIPLLYTGAPPHLVNDSTIEAAIWLHCRPGAVYRVNLRTGQPTRLR
jgi:hypothetical protein